MNPYDAKQKAMQYIREHSGFETNRSYLGMSHLSACARKQYFDLVYGIVPNDRMHFLSFSGYTFENIVLGILTGSGIVKALSRELVADFDPLLRGHTDGETMDGDLLEIKSINSIKFNNSNLPLRDHIDRVQTYMHFGNYLRTLLVYVCRDTFEIEMHEINYDNQHALRMANRAKYILSKIHSNNPPKCECGKCQSRSLMTSAVPVPVQEEEK